tara:strand:+ start:1351 stop:1617 length:267 start_codon:yes stop_codon:yes gene_type:complete
MHEVRQIDFRYEGHIRKVIDPPKFQVHEDGFVFHTYDHKECAEDQAKELNILDGLTEEVNDLIINKAGDAGMDVTALRRHVAQAMADY